MAQLVWDNVGDRLYETGLDRGVLYLENGNGVAWNGLTSVSEDVGGNTTTELYYDGVKYLDLSTISDFSGTLKAYTYPDEFLQFEGILEVANGMYADSQIRKPFGLSYRTLIGNDVEGTAFGYKLHILYDLTAIPQSTIFQSLSDAVEPIEFTWAISGRPQPIVGFRPTAHIIVDSRYTPSGVLANIEAILYGTVSTIPNLPTTTELVALFTTSQTIIITDNGNGTWNATGPDALITMLDANYFQITEANATFIDANTYTISSS